MNKRHLFTRRGFLKAGAAAFATISIVPRHVLGGQGFTPPSEVLTRAVIGTGGMGMGHVTSINTACKLLAVCDVDAKPKSGARKTKVGNVLGNRLELTLKRITAYITDCEGALWILHVDNFFLQLHL